MEYKEQHECNSEVPAREQSHEHIPLLVPDIDRAEAICTNLVQCARARAIQTGTRREEK